MGMYTEINFEVNVVHDENAQNLIDFINDGNSEMLEEDVENKFRIKYPLFLNKNDSRQSFIYPRITYAHESSDAVIFTITEEDDIELKNYNNTIENFIEDVLGKLDIIFGEINTRYEEFEDFTTIKY